MATLEVLIPEGYMNIGITVKKDYLFMDNNNSEYFNHIKIKLPKGDWELYSVKGNVATLKEGCPKFD
jgi:hypothetical protein